MTKIYAKLLELCPVCTGVGEVWGIDPSTRTPVDGECHRCNGYGRINKQAEFLEELKSRLNDFKSSELVYIATARKTADIVIELIEQFEAEQRGDK